MTSPVVPQESKSARLIELCKEILAERQLILVSNRGPVEYHISEDGQLLARRGSGGVVTAFSAISQYVELTWIAAAMNEGDRRAAEMAQGGRVKSPLPGQNLYLHFVVCPRSVYHKYYNIFSNPLLWFLQHYMWDSPYSPNIDSKVYDAWGNGYVLVNQAFAEAVVSEAEQSGTEPFVMLHDYHLYLVGGYIRRRMPRAILQHFTHIPWPSPRYWQLLPAFMRNAICESLCACDIVGLQTRRDVRNFLLTCESFLDGAKVDYQNRTITFNGRQTTVNAYPISIDVAQLQGLVRSQRVLEYEEKLRPYCGKQTIIRIDRLEPSRNIIRGFKAFDMLLQRYPDLVRKVNFIAFLVPSRTHIKQYQRYTEQVMELVESINSRYGNEEWQPIKVFYENNYPQAIAGMRLYDALLVNAVIDGMNLVAKEGPIMNTRDGVLILSEGVGAYEQLKEEALSVAPADIEATTQALYEALSMSPEEKKRRAMGLRRTIANEDIITWLCQQFKDLKNLACQLPLPAM